MTHSDETAAIAAVRDLRTEAEDPITVDQLTAVRDGVLSMVPANDIAANAGLELGDLFDEVAALGTWCTHVRGSANADIVAIGDLEQLPLFQLPTDEDRTIRGPEGFERRGDQRRNVSKALAAILVHQPTDDDLGRYLVRRYPPDTTYLTFEDVAVVHRLAQLGRLTRLGEIADRNVRHAQILVEGYDLLEVARADAVTAIKELVSTDVHTVGLDGLGDLVVKCRWLGEEQFARLERAIAAAERSDTSQAWKLLVKELRFLGRLIDANPTQWAPSHISMLNDGQIQRIAANAGLDIDAAVRRSEEAEVRARVNDLGFGADVDRLVHEGLGAIRNGHGDQFWDALQMRADGDAGWQAAFSELTGTAVTA